MNNKNISTKVRLVKIREELAELGLTLGTELCLVGPIRKETFASIGNMVVRLEAGEYEVLNFPDKPTHSFSGGFVVSKFGKFTYQHTENRKSILAAEQFYKSVVTSLDFIGISFSLLGGVLVNNKGATIRPTDIVQITYPTAKSHWVVWCDNEKVTLNTLL